MLDRRRGSVDGETGVLLTDTLENLDVNEATYPVFNEDDGAAALVADRALVEPDALDDEVLSEVAAAELAELYLAARPDAVGVDTDKLRPWVSRRRRPADESGFSDDGVVYEGVVVVDVVADGVDVAEYLEEVVEVVEVVDVVEPGRYDPEPARSRDAVKDGDVEVLIGAPNLLVVVALGVVLAVLLVLVLDELVVDPLVELSADDERRGLIVGTRRRVGRDVEGDVLPATDDVVDDDGVVVAV